MSALNDFDARTAKLGASVESPLEKALAEELRAAREEMRTAHEKLVIMSAELGWATDGRLSTGVQHVEELLRRRTEELETARLVKTDVEHSLMNVEVTSAGDIEVLADGRRLVLAIDDAELYEVLTTKEVQFPELPTAYSMQTTGEFWVRVKAGHLTLGAKL